MVVTGGFFFDILIKNPIPMQPNDQEIYLINVDCKYFNYLRSRPGVSTEDTK